VNYIQAGELGDFTPEWISDKLEKMESRKTNIVQPQKSFRSYRETETAYNAIMKFLGQIRPSEVFP
jgi:hypothetical protein